LRGLRSWCFLVKYLFWNEVSLFLLVLYLPAKKIPLIFYS